MATKNWADYLDEEEDETPPIITKEATVQATTSTSTTPATIPASTSTKQHWTYYFDEENDETLSSFEIKYDDVHAYDIYRLLYDIQSKEINILNKPILNKHIKKCLNVNSEKCNKLVDCIFKKIEKNNIVLTDYINNKGSQIGKQLIQKIEHLDKKKFLSEFLKQYSFKINRQEEGKKLFHIKQTSTNPSTISTSPTTLSNNY